MLTPLKRKELIRLTVVWAIVIGAIRLLSLISFLDFVAKNTATFVAAALVYPPVLLSFSERRRIRYWRFEKKNFRQALRVFSIVSLIVFPPAFLINHFYQQFVFDLAYHPGAAENWFPYGLGQLMLVSFPEEFFFRGYLQEGLNRILPPKRKIFGAPFGFSTLMIAVVFAVSHSLITPQWWHGFIFFPALIFGWLKEKTDTIWAGTLFHWACNLFAYWVAIHY